MNFVRILDYIEYYMHLDNKKVVAILRSKYNRKPLVYIIKCLVNHKLYVGGTMDPRPRFHKHLISGEGSNVLLQEDMLKYGRDNFVLYIVELLEFPSSMTDDDKLKLLRREEQKHMDKYPKNKLYNLMRSSAS